MRRYLIGVDRWFAWIRLGAVPFAAFQIGVSAGYPPGYREAAWLTTAVFAAGAVAFWLVSRRPLAGRAWTAVSGAALTFDFAVISAYVLIHHFTRGIPVRQAMYVAVIEGGIRFGMAGAFGVVAATVPVIAVYEHLRSSRFDEPYHWEFVSFQVGIASITALLIGWLVRSLGAATEASHVRAEEAESLRDELGRRADILDAANRCARALGSSLDVRESFGAFIRELRGLLAFDRVAIVLAEEDCARVMAAAGAGAGDTFPAGSRQPLAGTLLEQILAHGQPVYRRELDGSEFVEEREFLELGLHSRLAAPLLAGARPIGMVSLVRKEPNAFSPSEVELVSLLGRLVATAVQNIRAYDAERRTVEELRRLSALRADFVSLVSHELRSPMAAVIGAARTLQQRWRELSPEQRDAFLALIADETTRLAALIGDVLDTSRIDAGTFTYSFGEVDVATLVRETVAAAGMGQDEVPVVARVDAELPRVRGDAERLRQVLRNLVDNAVKYSPAGAPVEVSASADNGRVVVGVRDSGPGVAPENRRLIFEKFGRAGGGEGKPGTGLGLYIARSIAEAHGGTLEVDSTPGGGATFTLSLPAR